MYIDRINVNGGESNPILGVEGDRLYEGTDLTVKFADEIKAAPYNNDNDPWKWIQARIRAGNYLGIHIKDYIPFQTTNSVSLNAEIAGIDTYRNYGSTVVGRHIDFICRELWPTLKPYNPANYNNGLIPVETVTSDGKTTQYKLTKEMTGISSVTVDGTGLSDYTYDNKTFTLTFTAAPKAGTLTVTGTGTEFPWLASDLYLWLNSMAGQIPNGTTLNPPVKHVDYTTTGVYNFLPATLKAVIVEKHMLLNKRYSASGLLNNDNGWDWKNIGKLWLPTEAEVYGMPVWGNKDWAVGGSALQYPIFAGNMNRVKYRTGSRYSWWLLCPHGSNSTYWCFVNGYGGANYSNASYTGIAAPVCFRVA